MEVAGVCEACKAPGVLVTCAVCGALLHARCMQLGLHKHAGPPQGGERLPPPAR